jgi:endoglucanase
MQAPMKHALSSKTLGLAAMLGLSFAIAGQAQAATCSYAVVNEWNTGFQGSITITNDGTTAVNGWTVGWQYTNNRITSSWNATLSGSNPYSATALDWNKTIQPGQSVSFGVQGDKNSTAAAEKPTITGAVCSTATSSSVATTSSSSKSSAPSSSSVATTSSSKSSVPVSSSSKSSVVSTSSSSACSGTSQCNWYGTLYPSCTTTTSGWGYENGQSCIANSTCAAQPAPYGVVNGCPVSSSSSSVATSSSSSVKTSSSVSTSTSSMPSSSSSSIKSSSSSSVVSSSGAGVFRVDASGNITKNGAIFPAKCGNWFGLEGQFEPKDAAHNPGGAPMEMYVGNMWWSANTRTIQQTMTEIKAKGINMIRLPIAPQTLDATNPQGIGDIQAGGVLKNAPLVRQTNSRQALEDFIKLANTNNLQVLIDIHSCSNYVGWRKGRLDARPPYVDKDRENYTFTREDYSCAATNNPASVKTIHAYDEAKWLANLKEIAGLSKSLGVNNIIGIDIYNEPWDYTWSDWKTLSEHAFAAINSVNPDVLIFVEGISASANNQDGTPATVTDVPHGSTDTTPNWGENLFEAGTTPLNIPKDRLVFSPHTYGPSVFVQKHFMDPAQTNCTGLEGDAAGNSKCNIVINPARLRPGWEEHFGYLRAQGYAVVVGEFGGNMDWPKKGTVTDQTRWAHITTNVDQQWQTAFVSYAKEKNIQGCYWSINPESGDTAGWYLHSYDPVSNAAGWGTWLDFDARKTTLLQSFWQ